MDGLKIIPIEIIVNLIETISPDNQDNRRLLSNFRVVSKLLSVAATRRLFSFLNLEDFNNEETCSRISDIQADTTDPNIRNAIRSIRFSTSNLQPRIYVDQHGHQTISRDTTSRHAYFSKAAYQLYQNVNSLFQQIGPQIRELSIVELAYPRIEFDLNLVGYPEAMPRSDSDEVVLMPAKTLIGKLLDTILSSVNTETFPKLAGLEIRAETCDFLSSFMIADRYNETNQLELMANATNNQSSLNKLSNSDMKLSYEDFYSGSNAMFWLQHSTCKQLMGVLQHVSIHVEQIPWTTSNGGLSYWPTMQSKFLSSITNLTSLHLSTNLGLVTSIHHLDSTITYPNLNILSLTGFVLDAVELEYFLMSIRKTLHTLVLHDMLLQGGTWGRIFKVCLRRLRWLIKVDFSGLGYVTANDVEDRGVGVFKSDSSAFDRDHEMQAMLVETIVNR